MEWGPNCETQVMDSPLLTIPCHQQKALHSPCISTKTKPTTCWCMPHFKWNWRRRKQMAQGEAHLPTGHSKVTMPPGCLQVLLALTTPGVVGHLSAACTHLLCHSTAQVQGPRAQRKERKEPRGQGFWSLTSDTCPWKSVSTPQFRACHSRGSLESSGGCPAQALMDRRAPPTRSRRRSRLPGPARLASAAFGMCVGRGRHGERHPLEPAGAGHG